MLHFPDAIVLPLNHSLIDVAHSKVPDKGKTVGRRHDLLARLNKKFHGPEGAELLNFLEELWVELLQNTLLTLAALETLLEHSLF